MHDQIDKVEDSMRGVGKAKDAGGRVEMLGVLVSTLERESEAFPLLGFAGLQSVQVES